MKRSEIVRNFFIAAALMAGACLLLLLLWEDGKTKEQGYRFEQVRFTGRYQIDEGEWYELEEDTVIDVKEKHTVRLSGGFEEDIEPLHQMMFRLTDIRMKLWINGELVFRIGDIEDQSPISRTPGNRWVILESPGISKDDRIDIELGNVYRTIHSDSYSEFLNRIYYGSAEGLYRMEIKKNGFTMLLGLFIFTIGLAELLIAIELAVLKRKVGQLSAVGAFSITVGIWSMIQFDLIGLLQPFHMAIVTLDMFCLFMIFCFFGVLVGNYLPKEHKIYGNIAVISIAVLILLSSLLQIFGIWDIYENCVILLMLMFGIMLLLFGVAVMDTIRQKVRSYKIVYLLTPCVIGGLADMVFVISGISNHTRWTKYGFLITAFLQSMIIVKELKESAEMMESMQKMEQEMTQSRISIMMSQIQPHFLYNSLNTIQFFCEKDGETARKAIENFSRYLRGNMDSLEQKNLISLEKELEHLESYLHLERLRFNERLQIRYNLQERNIYLPALTIQPMVENAIRYGVTKKEEGGTVIISSGEQKGAYYICVEDDGVGFSPEEELMDERSHIGIRNVRYRLQVMCGGTLKINSIKGAGTKVTILIPKGINDAGNSGGR